MTSPDAEIVQDEAAAQRETRTPLLVLDVMERFLDEHGLGEGPLRAARIGEGSSNVTLVLERTRGRYVLRRPPRPPFPASAHDVVREARLQLSLAELGVRVPKIVALYEGDDLLGVPFYVSEYIEGDVLTNSLSPVLQANVAQRRAAVDDVVLALVEIHAADVSSPAIASFVRSGNYLERQLRRFGSLWDTSATRDIATVGEVAEWLRANLPEPGDMAVVHGDFRFGNVMLSPTPPVRVEAVLDWEMGAVGDPRADLGYFLATYSHESGYGTPLELSPVTALDGFPGREEIVDLYSRLSGRSVGDLTWFEVLALWKATVFCEAIYQRYLRGELSHDPFAAKLDRGVPALAAAAARLAEAA